VPPGRSYIASTGAPGPARRRDRLSAAFIRVGCSLQVLIASTGFPAAISVESRGSYVVAWYIIALQMSGALVTLRRGLLIYATVWGLTFVTFFLLAVTSPPHPAVRDPIPLPTIALINLVLSGVLTALPALWFFVTSELLRRLRHWSRWVAVSTIAPLAFVIVRLVVELQADPTSHNLWPIEVIGASLGSLLLFGLVAGVVWPGRFARHE
jgi:hypothetical protein